jgi:hypothetical protein
MHLNIVQYSVLSYHIGLGRQIDPFPAGLQWCTRYFMERMNVVEIRVDSNWHTGLVRTSEEQMFSAMRNRYVLFT